MDPCVGKNDLPCCFTLEIVKFELCRLIHGILSDLQLFQLQGGRAIYFQIFPVLKMTVTVMIAKF
jgi:hypothetical protein